MRAVLWSTTHEEASHRYGLLFAALPFTFDGVTPVVSKAQAVYRGIHHRHVVPAAAVGAAATGAGWGLPNPNWNPRVFATAAQFL
jgi:hypothetical protein